MTLTHPHLSYCSAWTLAERMARFGRKEGLAHWLTLESWLGMVIDAVLVKAMDSSEEEEPTIIGSLLGKEAVKLVFKIQRLLTTALDNQAVDLSGRLVSKTSQLLVMASRIWRSVKRDEEGPTSGWLKKYLTTEATKGYYRAWDKQDLIWAIYSYFL